MLLKPILGLAGPNPATRSLCGLNIWFGECMEKCLSTVLPFNLLLNVPRQIYLDSNLPILSTKSNQVVKTIFILLQVTRHDHSPNRH